MIQIGRPAEIVLSPANDYVRRFAANVNRARVLKVSDIMEAPKPEVNGAVTAHSTTLAQALLLVRRSSDGIHIENSNGNRIGYICVNRLISVVASAEMYSEFGDGFA